MPLEFFNTQPITKYITIHRHPDFSFGESSVDNGAGLIYSEGERVDPGLTGKILTGAQGAGKIIPAAEEIVKDTNIAAPSPNPPSTSISQPDSTLPVDSDTLTPPKNISEPGNNGLLSKEPSPDEVISRSVDTTPPENILEQGDNGLLNGDTSIPPAGDPSSMGGVGQEIVTETPSDVISESVDITPPENIMEPGNNGLLADPNAVSAVTPELDIFESIDPSGVTMPEGYTVTETGAINYQDTPLINADGTYTVVGQYMADHGVGIFQTGSDLAGAAGVVTLPEGVTQMTDGAVLLADGTVIGADGVVTSASGSIISEGWEALSKYGPYVALAYAGYNLLTEGFNEQTGKAMMVAGASLMNPIAGAIMWAFTMFAGDKKKNVPDPFYSVDEYFDMTGKYGKSTMYKDNDGCYILANGGMTAGEQTDSNGGHTTVPYSMRPSNAVIKYDPTTKTFYTLGSPDRFEGMWSTGLEWQPAPMIEHNGEYWIVLEVPTFIEETLQDDGMMLPISGLTSRFEDAEDIDLSFSSSEYLSRNQGVVDNMSKSMGDGPVFDPITPEDIPTGYNEVTGQYELIDSDGNFMGSSPVTADTTRSKFGEQYPMSDYYGSFWRL